ncbi:g1309 [Coccomyxa elongata]
MQNRDRNYKDYHGPPRDSRTPGDSRRDPNYARQNGPVRRGPYQPGGPYGPGPGPGPHGGPYPVLGPPHAPPGPHTHLQPWNYVGGPVAAHSLAQYPYAPGPVAYPPADALSFPPPGVVWQQTPPAAWQQPQSVEFSGQSLPWQQPAQMQQAAQVQQEEDPPPPPPTEGPPGPPPDPAEPAAAAPSGIRHHIFVSNGLASRLMDGAVPPLPEDAIRAVSMEVDQQLHATANGDRSETAAGEQAALEREAGSKQPDIGSGQQGARGPEEEPSMPLYSKKITTAPAELQPVSGGNSPAVSSQPNCTSSSPLKQTRPSFLKSNPPFLMTLKRRTAASLVGPSSGRSTPQPPEAPGASTPQPVQILADNGGAPAPPAEEAPAPQQNGDAPPKEEPAQRKRRRWDDAPIASPSAGAPLQGTPQQIAPLAKAQTPGRTPKKPLEKRKTKSRRRNQERGRGVTRSPSADSRSSSSSRTSSGDGTSTTSSSTGGSESPNRSRRRGAPQHRARARDSRSPAERTPSRRTDRLRSRPRSRSPYRQATAHLLFPAMAPSPTPGHFGSRVNTGGGTAAREHDPGPESAAATNLPGFHQTGGILLIILPLAGGPPPGTRLALPSRQSLESALSPALLEEHDGEVPPPPPDEPFPGELELQQEMEVIAGMDQRIKARIVDIAAQYGCEFNNLDIHGCRDFCETLYAHVYPEHPDFTAWDASDAAELAAMQEETTAGDMHFTQALPDISDIKLGPAPLELEDRPLLEVSEISVPLSPDEQAAKDPRNRPEPGELELEEPPLLLPVPLFALGPPEPSAVLGGDWEEDSVLSWSESPRLAGLTEEIESNKVVAPDEAQGEVMQAPAAPRHETIVRDDDRDWTKEQMARAQEQAATSLPRGPPKAPEKGGDWSWIEVHSHRGFGLTSRLYPLMDLRGWAEERRYGLQFGVSVYRQSDGLWLPLTEKAVQPEDLEWGGAGHTPLHAGSEEALRDPPAATVQVMTAPERDAAAMSDEAAWQWVEEASALPCALPTANGSVAGHALQDGLKDAGDASPSGADSLDVFAWFDEESSLKRLFATIGRVRMKEEAARKGRRVAVPDMSVADSGSGHRLWGGPPPPQHGATLRGKLATAVLSGAVGKTIVAEIIAKAARVVLEHRAAEVEARQAAQQARRAQRPAKPATPKQKGRGHGKASKSHHGKEAALASADRKRDAVQGKIAAGREPKSTDRHGQLRDGESAQERGSERDRKTPIKTESRSAAVPHQSASPKGDRAAEQAKALAVEASGKTERHGSSPALKETRVKVKSEQKSLPIKREPHESTRQKSQAHRAGGSDADWEQRSGAAASADKGAREKARKVQPKSRRLKHILDEDGSDGNELQSGDDAGGAAETANPRKRQRVHKTASLDAFQAHPMSAGPSAGGISATFAEAGRGQVQTPEEIQGGRPEHQEEKAAQKQQAGVLRTAEPEGRGHERAARSEDRDPGARKGAKKKGQKRQLQDEDFEVDEEERPKGCDDGDEEEDDEEKEQRQKAEQEKERRRMEALEQHRQKQSLEAFDNIIRALAKRDKQIDGLFMNPVDTKEFDSYLDIVKQPICIKDIMRKNKDKKYPPNKDGLDALVADVKLMCDNCRLFNKDGEAASEYIGYADEMEEHVRQTAELEWKKTSKMIGGRRV